MSKDTIVAKALKCIDEIYPSENTLNEGYFPTDAFIDEAVRWVIDIVPAHILTIREKIRPNDGEIEDGVVTWSNSAIGNARIVSFKMNDWARPADIIHEDSLIYRQQKNRVLRGTPSRPIAVCMMDGKTIEAYTSNSDTAQDSTVYIVPYNAANIPDRAIDLCAWKLAEVVLLSMSDMQNAPACTARVTELLQQLSL